MINWIVSPWHLIAFYPSCVMIETNHMMNIYANNGIVNNNFKAVNMYKAVQNSGEFWKIWLPVNDILHLAGEMMNDKKDIEPWIASNEQGEISN